MLLFISYWSGRYRWLKPTAGYPQDGKRWLFQVGAGNVAAYANDLVRGPILTVVPFSLKALRHPLMRMFMHR